MTEGNENQSDKDSPMYVGMVPHTPRLEKEKNGKQKKEQESEMGEKGIKRIKRLLRSGRVMWRRPPGGRPTSAEPDAELDSGRRGQFFSVMSSVRLSVCLFAGAGTA